MLFLFNGVLSVRCIQLTNSVLFANLYVLYTGEAESSLISITLCLSVTVADLFLWAFPRKGSTDFNETYFNCSIHA